MMRGIRHWKGIRSIGASLELSPSVEEHVSHLWPFGILLSRDRSIAVQFVTASIPRRAHNEIHRRQDPVYRFLIPHLREHSNECIRRELEQWLLSLWQTKSNRMRSSIALEDDYFDNTMIQIQMMFDIDLSTAWFEDRHTGRFGGNSRTKHNSIKRDAGERRTKRHTLLELGYRVILLVSVCIESILRVRHNRSLVWRRPIEDNWDRDRFHRDRVDRRWHLGSSRDQERYRSLECHQSWISQSDWPFRHWRKNNSRSESAKKKDRFTSWNALAEQIAGRTKTGEVRNEWVLQRWMS